MSLENQTNEIFESLKEYLTRFLNGLNDIVKWLHQGEDLKALGNMLYVVEGLEWISEVMILTKTVHGIDIELNKINLTLLELNEALLDKDTIFIADILEYEIKPLIQEWNNMINSSYNS